MNCLEHECGCKFYGALDPCEAHAQSIEAGDERLHVSLEWKDKYSDWPGNVHDVDLERVQRNHQGLESEPMVFNEESVADMLQDIADREPTTAAAFTLRALANALRGVDDNHRLVLQQKKRGKWQSPGDIHLQHRKHAAWLIRLIRLQREGWPTDAAIHRIAATTGNSVSRVYSGVAEANLSREHIEDFFKALGKYKRSLRAKGKLSPNKKL